MMTKPEFFIYITLEAICMFAVLFAAFYLFWPTDKPQVRLRASPALRDDDSHGTQILGIGIMDRTVPKEEMQKFYQDWLENQKKQTNVINLKQEALDSEYAKLWQTDI